MLTKNLLYIRCIEFFIKTFNIQYKFLPRRMITFTISCTSFTYNLRVFEEEWIFIYKYNALGSSLDNLIPFTLQNGILLTQHFLNNFFHIIQPIKSRTRINFYYFLITINHSMTMRTLFKWSLIFKYFITIRLPS
jgi:hypothetical protein